MKAKAGSRESATRPLEMSAVNVPPASPINTSTKSADQDVTANQAMRTVQDRKSSERRRSSRVSARVTIHPAPRQWRQDSKHRSATVEAGGCGASTAVLESKGRS